jgi:hypothetical protein
MTNKYLGMIVDLSDEETFLIEVLRGFSFLREFGYQMDGFYSGRGEYSVTLSSHRCNRIVKISWPDTFILEVEITDVSIKSTFLFSRSTIPRRIMVNDYYKLLNADEEKLKRDIKAVANFTEEYFMRILRGETWVNEKSWRNRP